MNRLLVHNGTCVLVCDGSIALFHVNVGDAQAISLRTIKTLHEPHPATRDLGTDRPGRSVDAMGGSRSSVAQTDFHDAAEVTFLRNVCDTLDEIVRDKQAKAVIVIAPPRALGVLRVHLSSEVRRVLQAEFDKDLVKMPTPKVEEYLQAKGMLR